MGTNPVNGNGYDSDDDTKIDPELQQFCENFTFLNLETCWVCNGYYGPSFGEPVCGTCHSFLFAAPTLEAPVTTCLSDDEDSGNDEPPYNNPGRSQNHDLVGRNANDNIELDDEDQDEDVEIEDDMTEDIPERNQLNMHLNVNRREIDFPVERPIPNPPRNVDQYLDLLSNSRPIDKIIPKIDALPTEVLLTIFSFLDDLSLANASEVCPRWKTIIQTYTSDQMWCRYTKTRWPLFQQIANVPNWLDMYSTLMSSCFCRSCLIEMAQKSPIPADVCKIRRLRNEIRSDGDATDGIDIVPLDAQMNHLQASIVGPQGSPYEGGKFFLYIVVGSSYPMLPPTVRFLTKILHPNVSRHGDVGIDIIQHNWSLALTISKILLSVQSLLTDPFTDVLKIVEQLLFDDEVCKRIKSTFRSEMENALNERPSSLQCENTYIPELPTNGLENGDFMALDLGGTNFRILLVEVKESKIVFEFFKFYHIEDDLRTSDGFVLFDFLAECIFSFLHTEQEVHNFVESRNIKLLPLGFTFSFPMKQHSLSSAELVTWTKTFNCKDLVGQCPVYHLNEAIHRVWASKHQNEKNDLQVEVLAVLNDTTGTLIQAAAVDPKVKIGVILGTGSNGAYMENVANVKHWEIGPIQGEKQVLIDVEWGAFGDNGVLDFIKTKYDQQVDDNSLLTSSFTFEKYIAGKYMGEIVRVILEDLFNQGILFHNAERERIKFPSTWMFTTNYVSHIEEDSLKNTNGSVIEILENFNYRYNIDFNLEDVKIIKFVVSVVSLRAAKLVACCLSVLLERILAYDTSNDPIGIGFDGSLYKHHPRMKKWIDHYINHFLETPSEDHNKKFYSTLATDGSGKGAALSAAIAYRTRNLPHRDL